MKKKWALLAVVSLLTAVGIISWQLGQHHSSTDDTPMRESPFEGGASEDDDSEEADLPDTIILSADSGKPGRFSAPRAVRVHVPIHLLAEGAHQIIQANLRLDAVACSYESDASEFKLLKFKTCKDAKGVSSQFQAGAVLDVTQTIELTVQTNPSPEVEVEIEVVEWEH